MHGRLGSGIAIAAALAALSGCGSSSSNGGGSSTGSGPSPDQTAAFKTGFLAAANGFGTTARAIGSAIQHASSLTNAQIGSEFHTLAGQWQSRVAELQTLTPPPKYATDFATVKSAAGRVTSDLNAIVAAAGSGDKNAARQAGDSVVRDVLAAKSAATSITNGLGSK